MASNGPPVERWLEHKAHIYHCYIIEDKTLMETIATLRDVHGFYASKTQYTTKLKAWGFKKNNPSNLYPCIEGSLKRKQVDLDTIQSVTISTPAGDKLIPYKKLKKALGRSNESKGQSDPPDAPSPPGLRVQYRTQARGFDFDLHHYPCISFITELSNVLMMQQTFLSEGSVPQQTHNNRGIPSLKKTSSEMAKLLNVNSIDGCPQVPPSFNQACKSLGITQHRDLKLLFQAIFLASNNQLGREETTNFREWLAKNIDVSGLCRMQSWTAKALLTHLLHGAVEMDDVTILRAAHTAGVDPDSPSSSGSNGSLLQHSLLHESVQCARYLINAGANVGALGSHQKTTDASEDVILERYSRTPLGMASRSHRCVALIPALLARGASPRGMLLLSACVRSGATCDTIEALLCAGVSPNEDNALSAAASLGRCDVMEVLLSAGAYVEGWYELKDCSLLPFFDVFRSPAIAAAESKCIEAIELLIRYSVDLNASSLDHISQDARESLQRRIQIGRSIMESDEASFHPIQAAVSTGDCGFVEFMIGKGAFLLSKYGHPLLVLAAQRSDVAMMTFLLARGADANMISGNGPAVSALEAAASRGCLPGIRLLLNAGADVNFCSQRPGSRTPLQRAAESRKVDAVELLLANGADIKAPPCPDDGISTLQALIRFGRLALVVRALAANAPVNAYPGTVGSPLLTAIVAGNIDLVSLLLRLGADNCHAAAPEAELLHDCGLPLQVAAHLGHLEICKVLVNNGADIDGVVQEYNEKTPLALACEEGNGSVVQYLISRNASLYGKTTSYVDTPLWNALYFCDTEIVQLLLENGVDANHFCVGSDKCGCRNCREQDSTPLIEVCEMDGMMSDGDEEESAYNLAKLLIEYGAKVNLRPSLDYKTPLQTACLNNETKLAKLLLSHGADINAPCSIRVEHSIIEVDLGAIPTGFNALQAAIWRQNIEMVDLFLSRGANVHVAASSTMRFTALQAAAIAGNIPIVERLLKAGASVDEPSSKPRGTTAIQGAAREGRLELLSLLLHYYKGTRIAEICDDAIVFAHENLHEHVVGFLRDYKEQHTRSLVVEGQEVVELDDWINWEHNS